MKTSQKTDRLYSDCIEDDLRRADVSKYRKTTGRDRMTLNDIAEQRQQWRELLAASVAETS